MKVTRTIVACALAAVVAKGLIAEFNQSSVLINTQLVQTEFYDGE